MGSALLWESCGVGKTRTAVTYATARVASEEVYRVLVVGPLASIGVWEDEFRAQGWQNILTRNDVDRLADLPKRAANFPSPCAVVVTYATLSRQVKFWADKWRPELVIIDESQAMRHYRSQRTRRMLALARSAPYKLLLSGTPAPNGYADLYWQIHAIQPGLLGANMQEFRNRYCVMGGYYDKEIVGYKNIKDLAKKLSTVTLRADKSLLNLPPVIDQTVPVALDPQAAKAYQALQEELVWQLEDGEPIDAPNQLVLLTRLMQITGGFLDDKRIGTQPKLQALKELVESYPSSEKLVVFAHYLQEIKAILASLDSGKQGEITSITGATTGRSRNEIVKSFQSDTYPRILVVQAQAGGIAITLTAASTAVYYSLDYNSETYEQSRGRIHRGGQKRTCHYLHLLARGTVDEAIYTALRAKVSRQAMLGELVKHLLKRR